MKLFRLSKRVHLARLVLTLGIAFAFAAQSYVTETHIHLSSFPGAATQSSNGKTPVDKDDEAHCPLCQAVAQAGNLLSPSPVLVPLPQTSSFVSVVVVFAEPALLLQQHGWQSRAPPQA